MADEALTVKGQSLFLYLKSTHSSFHSVLGIIKTTNTMSFKYKNNFENNGKNSTQQRC